MIPRETVGLILDTARIEDVVGEYVTLKRRGANYTACCPFHNEKTPSFYVSPSKGIYKCFGCGAAGGVVNFVMEQEHSTYAEALRWLAAKYHIDIKEEELSPEQLVEKNRRESLFLVSEFAMKFFAEALDTPEGRAVGRNYLRGRGLSDDTIKEFSLGWAPKGRTSLIDAAKAEGFKVDYLIDAGLAVRNEDGSVHDKFRERVMFPIFNLSGRVIAFSGRTLHADNPAKYVNSPETELYKKSHVLLGIKFAKSEISRMDKCILVEGNLDMVSLYQLGIHNVVAPCGTSLTSEQIRLIGRFTQNVTVMFDGDSAGIHAALRAINLILGEGMNVRLVLLPEGEDPDSFSRGRSADDVRAYIEAHEKDFVSFQTDMLLPRVGSDPVRRAELGNTIADSIALIADPIKRRMFISECASRFGVSADDVEKRISFTRREEIRKEAEKEERERRRAEAGLNPAGPDTINTEPAPVQPHVIKTGLDAAFDNNLLAPIESDLLSFVLKHGTEPMRFESDSELYAGEDENCPLVADFIASSLESDDVVFANKVLQKTFDDYLELYDLGYSQDEILRTLLNSGDPEVTLVVSELAFEKHELSVKSFRESLTTTESWLARQVPHTLKLYALKRLENMISEATEALKRITDEGAQTELMTKIIKLQQQQLKVRKKLKEDNDK